MIRRIAGGIGVVALWGMTGIAVAQNPTAAAPLPAPETPMSTPNGYSIHSSVDLGGRMSGTTGSGAMYDTLVNMQSGPRVLGESFQMRALPGTKNTLFDNLSAFGSGFGGDPNSFSKLDFYKGKLYEFSGLFRRDRQYFDYDLLGNPNIPGGQSIPIGPAAAPTGLFPWPQVTQSPFLFNTVRRMTDTNLTLLPLSKVTFRFGYSQNIFQGPSLTPSGYQLAGSYDVLLQEYQRNSTDDFTGGIDWKPVQGTKLTFEEQVDHYKGDSFFTMAPSYYTLQEANGTKVALLANYDAFTPNTTASGCNANSIANATTRLYAPQTPGGLPIVDPACYVITSYQRYQPTRAIFPTEIFRLQSTSIKNVSMNGNVRYTNANTNLPNYYDSFQGLAKANREVTYEGNASAKREVIAVDYGIDWQVTKKFSIAEQINFSNVHQPGTAVMTSATTVATPATAGNETINNTNLTTTVINTVTTPATSTFEGSPSVAVPQFDYFGQKFVTNNLTASWDVTDRTTVSLTYRYQKHTIAEGEANTTSYLTGATFYTIDENGGILNVAVRPTSNWEINGSVEALYADNVFTPVAPRELQHYRVHTMYRPKTWATVSGSYNDLERHNNTNNTGTVSGNGPLDHVDYSRTVSMSADLAPNEHYGFDFSYAYNDVYTATNICFLGQGTPTVPGAATPTGAACATPAPRTPGTSYTFGPARDFMSAPTQYASVALAFSPVARLHSNLGYRISSVNGSRFFNDPRDVNGSLVSTYQSPFVNLAWTVHKGFIWSGEYNYYGYGEGGPSGAQYCSTSSALPSPTTAAPVEACSALPNTAVNGPAFGFTAPRNFHANNVTLGMHYEF
jgi:hypothetical protein